jgi:hypothetical protein
VAVSLRPNPLSTKKPARPAVIADPVRVIEGQESGGFLPGRGRGHPFIQALPQQVAGLGSAFAALVTGTEFPSEPAHTTDALLGDSLSNLAIGDVLADADVHGDVEWVMFDG